MESAINYYDAKALLEWQLELGVDEAIAEQPINRYDLNPTPKKMTHAPKAAVPEPTPTPEVDATAVARQAAADAGDLASLRAAMEGFNHCELKRGARNTVFGDGNPGARVMVIGEAPGRDEDIQGRPFVGRAGQLLDKMLAAIDMGRDTPDAMSAVYITNILPWRPPQNRDPKPDEVAMLMPFVQKHIELVSPDILVLMGNVSCQALLKRRGITRLRGSWATALDLPTLPMFHPAYLLRNPAAKRDAWHDLLMLQTRLRGGT